MPARSNVFGFAALPLILVSAGPAPAVEPGGLVTFVRGDANGDGRLDISDAIQKLKLLFHGSPGFPCPDSADSDDSGEVDVSDPIHDFVYLFLGGPPPAMPFPSAGPDPTPDGLGC